MTSFYTNPVAIGMFVFALLVFVGVWSAESIKRERKKREIADGDTE